MNGIRLWHLPDGSAAGRVVGDMLYALDVDALNLVSYPF
jgi:hypothetical protein